MVENLLLLMSRGGNEIEDDNTMIIQRITTSFIMVLNVKCQFECEIHTLCYFQCNVLIVLHMNYFSLINNYHLKFSPKML